MTYLRTPHGREVNFLACGPAGEMELIQVCANGTSAETLEREPRALEETAQLYPMASKSSCVRTPHLVLPYGSSFAVSTRSSI